MTAPQASCIRRVDDDRTRTHDDVVLASLSSTARAPLEDLMAYDYPSDFAERPFAIGKAEGQAVAVVTVLETRGIELPAAVRARVLACADLATLDTWLARAATASRLGDVIGE